MSELEAFHLAHWRRQVGALYAQAREAGQEDAAEALARFRAARDRLFAMHPSSPLDAEQRGRFEGLDYFAHDPSARVHARLEPVSRPRRTELDLGGDGRLGCRAVAIARFHLGGTDCGLEVYALDGYGGGIWLPFTDATSGEDTYGGGRYVYDTVKGADLGVEGAHLPLDFNYAYNPSCAYNARWTCPLPPPDNRLPVPVRAGERDFSP